MSGLSQDLIITTVVSPKILGTKWKYEAPMVVFVSYRLNLEYLAISVATATQPQLSQIKQMHSQVMKPLLYLCYITLDPFTLVRTYLLAKLHGLTFMKKKLTQQGDSTAIIHISRSLPFSQSSWEEAGKWRDHRALCGGKAGDGGGEGDASRGLHVLRSAEALHHRHPVWHWLLHLFRYPM